MNYRKALLKIRLELIGMFPFVLLGRIYGRHYPCERRETYSCSFPPADLGGAIKVNADILDCHCRLKQPVIIFSKASKK